MFSSQLHTQHGRQWHANLTDVSLNIASRRVAGRLSTHERVLQLRLGAARRRYAPDLTVHRRLRCFRGTQEIGAHGSKGGKVGELQTKLADRFRPLKSQCEETNLK